MNVSGQDYTNPYILYLLKKFCKVQLSGSAQDVQPDTKIQKQGSAMLDDFQFLNSLWREYLSPLFPNRVSE